MAAVQRITDDLERTKRDDTQPLTLMFGNYGYRAVIINQMLGFHTLNFTNYEVVCLDHQLADFMASIGKPCTADLVGAEEASMWFARLQLIANLLERGISVLLTDADAVWIKNPMKFLKDADIVVQRGIWPWYMSNILGATACMGFAYFAGSPEVFSFFRDSVLSQFRDDDQVALNAALMENGIYFDHKLEWTESRNIDRGIIPATVDRRKIHVDFLDHYRFPRVCGPYSNGHTDTVISITDTVMATPVNADTVIAHCFTPHDGDAKITVLKSLSLYWLKDGWEQTPRNEDFEAFITSLRQ